MTLIIQASRASGSPFFALICLLRPIFLAFGKQALWTLREGLVLLVVALELTLYSSLRLLHQQREQETHARA